MTQLLKSLHLPIPFRRPKVTVGLDIGYTTVKLVTVEGSGQSRRATTAFQLPLMEGDLHDLRALFQRVSERYRETGTEIAADCIIGLPPALVDYQSLEWTDTSASPTEIEETVKAAMSELLGEDTENSGFDYWISHSPNNRQELNLVWSDANFTSRLVRGVARIGMNPLLVEPPALALARAACDDSPDSNRLIVDAGSGEATFIWCSSGRPRYIRNRIRWSKETAIAQLSDLRGIDPRSAEQILRNYGISEHSDNPIARDNCQALHVWLEGLLFEIRRTCQFLQGRYGQSAIRDIWLCGGTACIAGISAWIQARIGLETHCATVPSNCSWTSAEPFSPIYCTALSLALHGAEQ